MSQTISRKDACQAYPTTLQQIVQESESFLSTDIGLLIFYPAKENGLNADNIVVIEDFKTIASTALFLFVASLVFVLAAFYDLTHYVIKKLFLANL